MAQFVIDQAGIPAGTVDVSRTDGLDTGALVTLVASGGGTTFKFELLWVPPGDSTAVVTLAATGNPAIWTFAPTASSYGSYRIRLTTDEGEPTEETSIRHFAVRTPKKKLVIPPLNSVADPDASLVLNGPVQTLVSEDNSTDYTVPAMNSVTYAGWWRAMHELFLAADLGAATGAASYVQYSDGAGGFSGSVGFRYDDAGRDIYLRAVDGTNWATLNFEDSGGTVRGSLILKPSNNQLTLDGGAETLNIQTDDGIKLDGTTVTVPGGIIAMGTTPAGTGDFRVEEDWEMFAINQGATANIKMMGVTGLTSTTSQMRLGGSNMTEVIVTCDVFKHNDGRFEFGASGATVTGHIKQGTTPATTGEFRVEDTWSMYARNNGDTANLPVFNIVVIDATSSRVEVGSSNLDVNIRGALTQGGTPSTSGYYRTEAAWNMYARNQGNTANLQAINFAAKDATTSTLEFGSANMHVRQKGPTAYDEKTASFTVALGEEGTDLYCNSGSAIVITLTDDATQAIPINSRVFFYHEGAGALTVVAGGTATIIGGSKTSDGQTSAFVAWKVGADTWKVTGEVS